MYVKKDSNARIQRMDNFERNCVDKRKKQQQQQQQLLSKDSLEILSWSKWNPNFK